IRDLTVTGVQTCALPISLCFFVVVGDTLPTAERWLADLQSLVDGEGVALYPPRKGLGESEPHAEIAGKRVETLERVARGDVHIQIGRATCRGRRRRRGVG